MSGSVAAPTAVPAGAARPRRQRPVVLLLRRAGRLGRTRVGLVLVLVLVGTAIFGPFFAPHAPSEFVSLP